MFHRFTIKSYHAQKCHKIVSTRNLKYYCCYYRHHNHHHRSLRQSSISTFAQRVKKLTAFYGIKISNAIFTTFSHATSLRSISIFSFHLFLLPTKWSGFPTNMLCSPMYNPTHPSSFDFLNNSDI